MHCQLWQRFAFSECFLARFHMITIYWVIAITLVHFSERDVRKKEKNCAMLQTTTIDYVRFYVRFFTTLYVGHRTRAVLVGLSVTPACSEAIGNLRVALPYFTRYSSIVDRAAVEWPTSRPCLASTRTTSVDSAVPSCETVPLGPICLRAVVSSLTDFDDADPIGTQFDRRLLDAPDVSRCSS